ncbi:restriction endonuclease subunit S [Gordonia sp. NPDC062954]|uniref:restriction endonuclease subunit S n=1 Tax=Gordonia sp. NPDC062954 TaxID=3364003 RepID=UPI0037C8612C
MSASENFPLASITTWSSGGTPNRSNPAYWNGAIPWISAATLKGSRIVGSDQYLTEAGLRAGSKLAPVGATLVLVRGMALHRETRIGLAQRRVSFNQDVKALVPKSGVLPEFLLFALQARSAEIRNLVSSAGSGTGVLNTQLLQRLPVWVPDEGTQRAVIQAMSNADDLIATLERLIAKKQAIKQGMMQQLLTGRTRLPGCTRRWRTATVGQVASVKTGPFGSSLHERDYVAHGTPIITVEHLGSRDIQGRGAPMVSDSDRNRLKAYALAEGDIVFSRVGSIDRNALVSSNEVGWLFSGRLLRVRFDRTIADPVFMSAQFHSNRFIRAVKTVAVGQTMPSLNTAILKGIQVSLPPIEEQRRIGKAYSDLDAELGSLESRLQKARAIKTGMMQQLLTGRTRLPVEATS